MPATIEQAFPSNLYGGRLTIDLDAIVSNWSLLKGKVSDSTDCAAVLKADAYGTGQDWWARYHETMREANNRIDARFGAISSKEVGLLDGFFDLTARQWLQHLWGPPRR